MKRLYLSISNNLPIMADIPVRRISGSSCKSSKHNTTPIQILLQMGFPRHRALKALAATGNRSVQLASDWLLTHVNDAHLDTNESREYIFYASPTGRLLAQLHEFWDKSKRVAGWNGAHKFPPHLTLVSFFKAPDETSLQLAKAVKHVVENAGEPPSYPLKLEPYVSQNFMGLFISDKYADYLKEIAVQYVKQVSSALGLTYERLDTLGTCFPWCTMPQEKSIKFVSLEPHVKPLHITLAYHFDKKAYDPLKDLVDKMQPLQETGWELRLYSRDPRFSNHQVYKVTQRYEPKASDELELVIGDYIYVEEEQMNSSPDGWLHGTSWLTGVAGYVPAVYLRRTAESDAWTLHRAMSLSSSNNKDGGGKSDPKHTVDSEPIDAYADASLLAHHKSEEIYKEWDNYWNFVQLNRFDGIVEVTEGTSFNWEHNVYNAKEDKEKSNKRWVFGMRHGERVDLTFGPWVNYCFDENDKYVRKDLNLPITLGTRKNGKAAYDKDTPLTRVGRLQARLAGEGLRLAGVPLAHVYASAALRCVETAHELLEGLQADPSVKIRVEPGLFEYKAWHLEKGLQFMTLEELHAAGYNVDMDYKPYIDLDVSTTETVEEFYSRNEKVMQSAILSTEKDGGNVIFVGHASTLDLTVISAHALRAGARAPPYAFSGALVRVPYCALCAVRGPPWRLAPPPLPPCANSSSARFDWRILTTCVQPDPSTS